MHAYFCTAGKETWASFVISVNSYNAVGVASDGTARPRTAVEYLQQCTVCCNNQLWIVPAPKPHVKDFIVMANELQAKSAQSLYLSITFNGIIISCKYVNQRKKTTICFIMHSFPGQQGQDFTRQVNYLINHKMAGVAMASAGPCTNCFKPSLALCSIQITKPSSNQSILPAVRHLSCCLTNSRN